MKKILTKLMAAALMVLGGASFASAAVYAEDGASSLKVSPSGTNVQLTAGATLEGTVDGCVSSISDGCFINVENTGSRAFNFKVYVTPYAVTGSDNELDFSAETTYTQIARWIQVKNAEGEYVDVDGEKSVTFSAAPGEVRKVEYRINVPESIPGGAQYAVLWAQILNDADGEGIQTVGQVGSVIKGRSNENTIESAEVSGIDMTRFTFKGPLQAKVHVKNAGNTDFVINYTYTAKTFFGKEIYTNSDRTAAYPEMEYDVAMEWETPPMLGVFNVEFTVNAADQNVTVKHVVVVMPVLVLILLILLLTVVVVWIIIIIRKRKERKARKLV